MPLGEFLFGVMFITGWMCIAASTFWMNNLKPRLAVFAVGTTLLVAMLFMFE